MKKPSLNKFISLQATPKVERKVKKRQQRKVKRRNNAVVGQENGSRNGQKTSSVSPANLETSSESDEDFIVENRDEKSVPRIVVINQKPAVTVKKPFQITYRTPTSTDDDSHRKQRRSQDERSKTLPITFTVKQAKVESEKTASSDEDTLTSGGELSERDEKRTSIRIVSSSAVSSETERPTRKLQIEAKSLKRKENKENEQFEREKKSKEANRIYNDRTRRFIKRQQWDQREVEETELDFEFLEDAESVPDYKFQTLPRNFKTVRVPIQTQSSPAKVEKRNQRRRLSQPINLRSPLTEKSESVSSDKSPDTCSSDLVHLCRRGCTHVVDDITGGPRVVRRSRENRRKSNPNQILGRTDIQGLRKTRPKSEIIRTLSLPRSTERPQIKSTGFEEFVEINDLGKFSRSKTLPRKKKRVTYHEGIKEQRVFSESEVSLDIIILCQFC